MYGIDVERLDGRQQHRRDDDDGGHGIQKTAHDQQKKTCQKDLLPAYLLYTESVALFFSKGWFLVFCIHICIVSVTDRFDQLKNMIFLLKISEDCPVKLQNMI